MASQITSRLSLEPPVDKSQLFAVSISARGKTRRTVAKAGWGIPAGNKQLRRKRVKLDQSLLSGYRFSEPTCCRPSVFRAPFLGLVWPIPV